MILRLSYGLISVGLKVMDFFNWFNCNLSFSLIDAQYNVTVKHAWKFHETHKDKWYLVYAKSAAVKERWLKAIQDQRQRVLEDQENGESAENENKRII